MSQPRIIEFDMMKGIGILSMIICHRLSGIPSLYEFIHTFHMPLFVFISGYLYKDRPFVQMVLYWTKRTLLPFAFVCIIFLLFDSEIRHNITKSVLYSNPPLWVVWFLPSLFIVQLLANLTFQNKLLQCVTFSLSIISSCLFEKVPLPIYIWQGLFMYPFFWVGYHVRLFGLIPKSKETSAFGYLIFSAIAIWTVYYLFETSSLRLSMCNANWFLIGDVIASASACFCVYVLCGNIIHQNIKWLVSTLVWIGRLSMIILCLHAIDHLVLQGFPWFGKYWQYTSFLGNQAFPIGYLIIELPTLFMMSWIVCRIKPLAYVFGVK